MCTLKPAVMLILCGFAATAQAAAVHASDHVQALGPEQSVMLTAAGNAVFADVVFPDPKLADAWFASHLLQKNIDFIQGDADRYGRAMITGETEADMLRDGIAVNYSTGHVAPGWQAAEDAARLAHRGVWGAPDFTLNPENAALHEQEFHVVEGIVKHIYAGDHATYLNFGEDWHTDFSVTIPGRARRSFKEQLDALKEGDKLRVRGAIYEENGPMIRITRPEQLQVIR
jgi:hypothetical protein